MKGRWGASIFYFIGVGHQLENFSRPVRVDPQILILGFKKIPESSSGKIWAFFCLFAQILPNKKKSAKLYHLGTLRTRRAASFRRSNLPPPVPGDFSSSKDS